MNEERIGYTEDPVNGDDIWRARTTRLIRAWKFEKSVEKLDILNKEYGNNQYPGIYILFETTSNKVYIGEAGSLISRLRAHTNTPDTKITKWNRLMIINDGRSSSHSDLNDAIIRREIEHYLNELFKLNKYKVVSQSSKQHLNAAQKIMVSYFIDELNFFMLRTNIINKLPAPRDQRELTLSEMKSILQKRGYQIENLSAYEVELNGKKSYIRSGSSKPKGWQITFRDQFKKSLETEDGFLIIPRGGCIVLPLHKIKQCIANNTDAFDKNTIDVFIQYQNDKIILSYKNNTIDISEFKL
ncbi:MAG: GIY-YIG nuclease family protein [Candidatus Cloacimonetes bacterium]|nr:GIY-YIG nuclease family protein [Candidatus Cloacimonadota bacterium]